MNGPVHLDGGVPHESSSTERNRTNGRGAPATISDVAALAGVSTATVSRVLNHHANVSPAVIVKVSTAIERLQYQKNKAAAQLRQGRARTVTLVIANLSQPWYATLTSGIRRQLSPHGYEAVVHDLGFEFGEADLSAVLSTISPATTDAVLLATASRLDEPRLLTVLYKLAAEVPLVVLGQPIPEANWSTVSYADRRGAREAVGHLVSIGCRSVAFLGQYPNSYLASERFGGYQDALVDAGLFDPRWVWQVSDFTYGEGYAVTSRMTSATDFPQGIFAVNDELAIGAMRALPDISLHVPDDVCVVGFGNGAVGSYLPSTTLSTVDGSAREVVSAATEALLKMINGGGPSEVQYVSRGFINRESTRGPG
jgi:LacI family repressor for deo operon, udp, cdd, tsx, nupC, and nupG